jgi:hypothetical protein
MESKAVRFVLSGFVLAAMLVVNRGEPGVKVSNAA